MDNRRKSRLNQALVRLGSYVSVGKALGTWWQSEVRWV